MASINKQISRYEFTAVYSHPDAKVDIVLVHGLNGHPEKTWTAKNGIFWPTDLLPVSLKGTHANVLVYGYNADVYSSNNDRSASDNYIHQHAQTLIISLTHYRKSEDTMRNPIIWVAHSLGGILTKRALLYSNDLRVGSQEDYRSIFVSSYGIIFLGTPHMGTDIATWGHMLQSMSDAVVPKKFFDTEPILIKTLKKDNETLQSINNHFLDIYQRFKMHMVHENHKTDVKGTRTLVVDAASASPQLPGVTYYGIEATHSAMCKFDSPNAPGWRTVSTALHEWVLEAPSVVHIRWRVEGDDRELRTKLEVFERSRSYDGATQLTRPQGTLAIHDRMIMDNSQRFERTSPRLLLPSAQDTEMGLNRPEHQRNDSSTRHPSQIFDDSGHMTLTPVIEQSSSNSETDSATMPPGQDSYTTWVPLVQEYGVGAEPIQLPIAYGATEQPSSYRWNTPYPYRQSFMPASPDPDNGNEPVFIPISNTMGRSMPHGQGKILGESGSPNDSTFNPSAPVDELERPPSHRVIRKNELRRYHDRAGAWRDQTVSDPRVSVNREVAKGSISGAKADSSYLPVQSHAESHLSEINRSAPPPTESKASPQDAAVTVPCLGPTRWPQNILGRNSYAEVIAGEVVEATGPPEFSKSLSKIVSAPSSWTTATLKRLRENFGHSSLTSAEATPPVVEDSRASQHLHKSDEAPISPGPIFQGTRTSNSSPANMASPQIPSASAPPTLPLDIGTGISAPEDSPPAIQQWDNWDNTTFHPIAGRLESSSLIYEQDLLSFSFPAPSRPMPYAIQLQRPPQPWLEAPTGYSSQPMSRMVSHQSGNQFSTSPRATPAGSPGSAASLDSPYPPAHATHHSSPLAGSSRGYSPLTGAQPFVLPVRTRRPSCTETEPSPRLEPAFPDVNTSYSRWGDTYAPQYGERRAISAVGTVIGEGPLVALPVAVGGSLPVSVRKRFVRGGFRGRGHGSNRSQSQSPSPRGRRLRNPFSSRFSPEPPPGSSGPAVSEPSGGEPMMRSTSAGGSPAATGEEKSRPVSAGIMVGDGRVVEFGTPPRQGVRFSPPPPVRRRTRSQSSSRSAPRVSEVGLGIQQ